MTTSAKLTEILALPSVDEQIDALKAIMGGATTLNDEQRAVADDPRWVEWLQANHVEIIKRRV